MRVLFDEDVPHPLAKAIEPFHDVRTVAEMGWAGVKNGDLLELAEDERFEAFLTGDKNLPHQQDLSCRPFAVPVLSAINWAIVRNHVESIIKALKAARPGTVTFVDCGFFLPRRKRKT
ncbi:MAG TPA: DUF5615 family PIN-like protein [Terracidiphilus sp.]|nr:DUF5615 family PIN-like protein [Terracidiphilus sp.]